MVSFAVGAMPGAAFLHLPPAALSQANSIEALFATLPVGKVALILPGIAMIAVPYAWLHAH